MDFEFGVPPSNLTAWAEDSWRLYVFGIAFTQLARDNPTAEVQHLV